MRKEPFICAWYHVRLAIGFALVGLATLAFPVSTEKSALVQAMKPYEWEAGE